MTSKRTAAPRARKVPALTGTTLVTGANDLLGRAFIRLLESRGCRFIRSDSVDADLTELAFDNVAHFGDLTPAAAPADVGHKASFAQNVESTRRLLRSLSDRKRPVRRFVNLGSAAEYGPARGLITERSRERPVSDYGRSKLEQTRLVEQFARDTGTAAVNLRVFNVAALNARAAPDGGALQPTIFDSLIAQLENGPQVSMSNRKVVRDFVDVEDIANAVFLALAAPKLSGYHLVNVATGQGVTLARIADLLGAQLGKVPRITDRQAKFDSSVGDPARAQRLLGWRARIPLQDSIRKMVGKRTRVLIVGAGAGGRAVAKELHHQGRSGIVVIGLVDDDARKMGKLVGGSPVLGKTADLPQLIRDHAIDQVLLSTPSVGSTLAARIAELLPPGFPIRVLPSATSVLLGRVDTSQIRDIDPADLVGRPLIKADQRMIAQHAAGKTFLVTGGAGSIGSEIVRQLCAAGAARVVLFDAWEEGVFNLLAELKSSADRGQLLARIGNVRDRDRLDEVIASTEPGVIIHAAAYKHVPLMEDNGEEAHKTNVTGTANVLELMDKHGVADFVLISTDKAVRPANIMGKTKRAAELLVQDHARRHPSRRRIAVRFGNVLNSSGSVIPTFLRQIRNRQPVTVTHPDMTRYFMSVPEAVSLVLQSWIVGANGQILLLDMGQPMRILDLALRLIRIHGLEPYKDIPVEFVGVRPGEKLFEELAYDGALKKSPLARIFIAEEA